MRVTIINHLIKSLSKNQQQFIVQDNLCFNCLNWGKVTKIAFPKQTHIDLKKVSKANSFKKHCISKIELKFSRFENISKVTLKKIVIFGSIPCPLTISWSLKIELTKYMKVDSKNLLAFWKDLAEQFDLLVIILTNHFYSHSWSFNPSNWEESIPYSWAKLAKLILFFDAELLKLCHDVVFPSISPIRMVDSARNKL